MFLFTAPCKVLKATVSPGRPKLLPAGAAGAAVAGAPAADTSENGYVFEFSIVGDKKNILRGEAMKLN